VNTGKPKQRFQCAKDSTKRLSHKTIDFSAEPTEAEATEVIEKDYPHLKVERIDWIRDMSHKANELNEYYSKR